MSENDGSLYDKGYSEGKKAAWNFISNQCIMNLMPGTQKTSLELLTERKETISVLRDLCMAYGDNDWPDSLHLADIIDKHLGIHLDRKSKDETKN